MEDEYAVRPLRQDELDAWLDHLAVRTNQGEGGVRAERERERGRNRQGGNRDVGWQGWSARPMRWSWRRKGRAEQETKLNHAQSLC